MTGVCLVRIEASPDGALLISVTSSVDVGGSAEPNASRHYRTVDDAIVALEIFLRGFEAGPASQVEPEVDGHATPPRPDP